MKPLHRNRRLGLIGLAGALLAGAAFLVFNALERNVSYFYSPSEAIVAGLDGATRVRLGGLVVTGSIQSGAGVETAFKVTDGGHAIDVAYKGILPDLFREGQGVIAQGRFNQDGVFIADTILAKHDENYVPKELIDIVENAGQ